MFIFQIKYFSLILNPEIKFIILKRGHSESTRKNNGEGYWERLFLIKFNTSN
jgi:hypothetical protein